MNILDNIIFSVHTFGVRRSIDALDPENQPGSGHRGRLTPKVCKQKDI